MARPCRTEVFDVHWDEDAIRLSVRIYFPFANEININGCVGDIFEPHYFKPGEIEENLHRSRLGLTQYRIDMVIPREYELQPFTVAYRLATDDGAPHQILKMHSLKGTSSRLACFISSSCIPCLTES